MCKKLLRVTVSITIPLARLLGAVMSLMTAKLRLMLPLLTPPMTRAIKNTVKLCETAHTAYDSAIPTCHNSNSNSNVLCLMHDSHLLHTLHTTALMQSKARFPLPEMMALVDG